MKTHFLIAAILVAGAIPAAAQTAPSADHQAHAEHGQMGHEHMEHGQGDPSAAHSAGHEDHHGQMMEDGCCADSDGDGRMDCCENMAEGRSCCPSSEQAAEPESDEHQNSAE